MMMLKLKLAIIWAWLKKNWKLVATTIAMGTLIVYAIITKKNNEEAIKALQNQLDQARKDYDKAQELHRLEILRRDQIEENYQKVIRDLQNKYKDQVLQLDNKKKEQIRQIVAETHDDPQAMATRINTTLGIQLYNPTSTTANGAQK